jgi:hypothetical protein
MPLAGIEPAMGIEVGIDRTSQGSSLQTSHRTMPGRTGPRMRGAPNFAERKERASARRLSFDARQNRLPRAPLRGACGVLDPARPGQARKGSPFITTVEAAAMSVCPAGRWRRFAPPATDRSTANTAATSAITSRTSTSGQPRRTSSTSEYGHMPPARRRRPSPKRNEKETPKRAKGRRADA